MDEKIIELNIRCEALQRFLDGLPANERAVFVLRYTGKLRVSAIAKRTGYSVLRVALSLRCTRRKLRKFLAKEGWL